MQATRDQTTITQGRANGGTWLLATRADCHCPGRQAGMQISLTPIGARLLLGVPLSELADRSVAVVDLLPPGHRDLPWRLEAAPTWAARFDLLDAALLDCVSEVTDRTRIVRWGYDRIVESGGRADIGRLARELGYSHKHIVRLFRDQVGMPPKRLARLVRFEALARRIRQGRRQPWSDLAFELGFSDQAHLIREARRHSGLTPTQLELELCRTFGADADVHFVQGNDRSVA